MNFPYAGLGPNKELQLLNDRLDYPGLTLMKYSALVNYLDNRYISSVAEKYDSPDVSRAVLNEFWSICKANGIEFVLAGIYPDAPTKETLNYFKGKGASVVDISVDMTIKENSSMPYDTHPSAIANKQFAEKLETFLRPRLEGRAGHP